MRDDRAGKPMGNYPEFPFCFPGDDSIPPVAAAATFFCIRSRAKEPDAPGHPQAAPERASTGSQKRTAHVSHFCASLLDCGVREDCAELVGRVAQRGILQVRIAHRGRGLRVPEQLADNLKANAIRGQMRCEVVLQIAQAHGGLVPLQLHRFYKQDSRLLDRLPIRGLKATTLDTRRIKIAASAASSPLKRRR
jgi:hypothetical protein